MDENRPLHYEPFLEDESLRELFPNARTTPKPTEVTCAQCVGLMRGVELPR